MSKLPSLLLLGGLAIAASALADEEPGSRRATAVDPRNLCEVADNNLGRAVRAILAAPPAPAPSLSKPPSPSKPWDHRQPPLGLDRFERRFTLSPAERTRLFADGVVVPARLRFDSYSFAFHELHQSQLPLYVSIDPIFHAIYASSDGLVAELERELLLPKLTRLIAALQQALPAAAAGYPPTVRGDLAIYLEVAARLLGAASSSLTPAIEPQVAALVAAARQGGALVPVELFGRTRMVDWSAYRPRGHYADAGPLAKLFQGAMWLSRLEFNLVSRSSRSSAPGATPDPRETPEEALCALALADLVERSGMAADLALLDRAWTLLGGRREDVSVAELGALRRQAAIADLRQPEAAAALRRAIGDRFQRTAQLHYMPEGSTVLPAIATLLGPRVVADAAALRLLSHSQVADRQRLYVGDVVALLGQPRGLDYLSGDLHNFPTLGAQHERARSRLAQSLAQPAGDLYSAWLRALQALAERPTGQLPTFLSTAAGRDLRLNSTVAAFAQLKHNYVLIAGQEYNEGGCEIPDGYVEPVPAVYAALIDYAARGEQVLAALDSVDRTGGRAYFQRLGRLLQVLRRIALDELAGRPLSVEERRFLAMVSELAAGSSGGPPTYTGWYFDLFRQRQAEGLATSDLIADYYTASGPQEVAYAGVAGLELGLFVVDTGGAPRLFVGPVARAFEHHGPLAARLDDEAGRKLPEAARQAPWAASYTVAAPAHQPSLAASYQWKAGSSTVVVSSEVAIGAASVALLDHHRQPLATVQSALGVGETTVRFPLRGKNGQKLDEDAVGGISIRVGEHYLWAGRRGGGEPGIYLSGGN